MSDQPDNHRYQQAKTILQRALDLTPGERAAYLDAACGTDTELRAEVRSLLDAHEAAGSRFLRDPARPDTDPDRADEDVDLTGQRVGAYRLERLIRRGGMGAVYLAARDDGEYSKHVAIKFIRPSVLSPALLKRFKVERQILADFDHPGIARLIDGGTTEHGMPFFIMEYVQGEALDDVLLHGPLPQPRAVRLAVSVAEVLEAIHSKGLVYRDLKPSNIMLTGESGLKILDFGIAKIMQDETGSDRKLTEPGWIVGSPPYMSPEQASGGRIDARSDVFSYGVVIFEALTGHLPFSGDTREEYVRNLISAEPKALPVSVPARLRAVVDRCLKKAPSDRFSSGGELAFAVRAAVAPDVAPPRPASRLAWVAVAALALVAGALGVWALVQRDETGALPLLKGPPQMVATWASSKISPRISPDGRWTSFISDRDGATKLWLINRLTGAERAIEPAGGAIRTPVWSPTSDRLAYIAPLGAQSSLVIAALEEGKPLTFTLRNADTALVRWIGERIYYISEGSLWRLDTASGQSREVTTERGPLRIRNVDISADEQRIVFTAIEGTISSLWRAGMDGSGAVRLTTDRIDPRYVRWRGRDARQVVYVSNQGGMVDVWLLNVATGARQPLTITDAREGQIDVSDDGSVLVYEQIREESYLAVLDPSAKIAGPKRMTSDSLSELLPSASSSDTEVAFQRSTASDMALGLKTATIQVTRAGLGSVPFSVGEGYGPEISPDGRWVAYFVWLGDSLAELWVADVQSAERRPLRVSETAARFSYVLFPTNQDRTTLVWSPKEPRLFFVSREPDRTRQIWTAVPGPDGVRAEPLSRVEDDTSDLSDLQVSGDGTRLSYVLTSRIRGVSELRVIDLTRNREETVLFSEKASFRVACPGWTEDGEVVVLRWVTDMPVTDVLMVRSGQSRGAGQLRDVTQASVTLDPRRRTLYFTRDQGSAHSLHAWSLAAGTSDRERLVYQGEPHGRALSGIRVLRTGQLLFSFQSQRHDILSNEFPR